MSRNLKKLPMTMRIQSPVQSHFHTSAIRSQTPSVSIRHVHLFLTFDCFGTLYTPHPAVNEQYFAYLQSLPDLSSKPSAETIGTQLRGAFKHMAAQHPNYNKARLNPPLSEAYICASKEDQHRVKESVGQWWSDLVRMAVHPAQLTQDQVRGLVERFDGHQAYGVYPDVVPSLRRLRQLSETPEMLQQLVATGLGYEADLPTVTLSFGVLSNSDPRVFGILDSLGLLQYFPDAQKIFLSYDTGIDKPDPAAFQYVASAVRSSVAKAVDDEGVPEVVFMHIGDELEKDQRGAARVAGWSGVYVDRRARQRAPDQGGGQESSSKGPALEQSLFHVSDAERKAQGGGYNDNDWGVNEELTEGRYVVGDLMGLEDVIVKYLRKVISKP